MLTLFGPNPFKPVLRLVFLAIPERRTITPHTTNSVLFPPDRPFTVELQSRLIAESREPIDFLVEYQVLWENASVPVFILEIETGPKLDLVSV